VSPTAIPRLVVLEALLAVVARGPSDAESTRPIDLNQLGAPAFATFTPRDGVPDAVSLSLATDKEGFVWLASVSGISRYDGQRWEGVPAPPGVFRCLFLDHTGTLWLTYDDKRPARLENGRWRPESGAMPTELVFRIIETPGADGGIDTWAVTVDGGLMKRVGDAWVSEPGNEQLPRGRLHSVARTSEIGGEGRLWVATFNDGLWYRGNDGRWKRHRAGRFDPAQVDDLLVTRDHGTEELWVATYGLGLWRITNSGADEVKPDPDVPGASMIYTLQASASPDGGRVVWGSSRGGLLFVHGADIAQVFDRRHGLPSNGIRYLHLWKSPGGTDVLWIATEAGVARTAAGHAPWRTASLLGSSGNGVFGVFVEPDGHGSERLWVTTLNDGIGLYENGRWRKLGPKDSPVLESGARLVTRALDGDGGTSVFLGIVGGELVRVREGLRFERVPTPWPKDSGQVVLDLLTRRVDGRLETWFATRESGLWRLRDGRFTSFRPSSVVDPWRTVKLAEQIDSSGRSWLWATSNQGLARFDGETWTILGKGDGLPDVDLLGITLLRDRAGGPVLWLGSYLAGIVRVDVTDPLHPRVLPAGDLPPAPNQNAYGALRDSKGLLYVCTNNGVQLLTRDARGGLKERVFKRGDGLVHEECNTNAEFIDAHDRYWMGTLGGLSVFDPADAPSDRDVKPLKITHVRIDGAEASTSPIRLEPGARELRVEFALLSWQREAESRFRAQLVGYDPAPGPWGPLSYRVYGALPPGTYVLRVEARDYAGLDSAPLELPVQVLPAWWQSLWFRCAAVLFFAVVGPLFYSRRVRRLSRQKSELESLVLSRTAELAAANERLGHLSREDALTGLANRRRLDEALDDEWRRAARLELPLALLLLDVDHFKNYNDRLGHPAGDTCLAAIARAVAAANTRAGEVVARYGGEEFAVLIPGAAVDTALASAENVRKRVLELGLPHPESDASSVVTVSVGAACVRPGRDPGGPAELVEAADRALYAAKTAGRNCVRLAPPIPYTPPP
jgi:diguanylate cyclase (GGDEF)-like protein